MAPFISLMATTDIVIFDAMSGRTTILRLIQILPAREIRRWKASEPSFLMSR